MLPPSRPQLAFIWQDAWTVLDQAFGGPASRAANLRLNGLLTDLVFSDVAVRQEKPLSRTQVVAQELSRFLERLRGRTKPSGLVAVWCRSFDSVMCSKGDEPWAQSGRMNFARMRCGSR